MSIVCVLRVCSVDVWCEYAILYIYKNVICVCLVFVIVCVCGVGVYCTPQYNANKIYNKVYLILLQCAIINYSHYTHTTHPQYTFTPIQYTHNTHRIHSTSHSTPPQHTSTPHTPIAHFHTQVNPELIQSIINSN